MEDASPVFTVARIAATLGVHRKTVAEQVACIQCAETRSVVVGGQRAAAFTWEDLPVPLKRRVAGAARAQGFENPERFLEVGPQPWKPSIPVGKLPPGAVSAATRRAAVIGPLLVDRGTRALAEIAAEARRRWSDATSEHVSVRTVRRWVDRAIERDRGFEKWDRWEIYLEDGLRPVVAEPPTPSDDATAPRTLQAIRGMGDPARPTADELVMLWIRALADADDMTRRGHTEKRARLAICDVIERAAVPVSKNRESLLKLFQRKREKHLETGGSLVAVQDGRVDANRSRKWELPEEDYRTVLRLALEFESLATGWRYACKKRLLSQATLERFPAPNADKSYVPHSVSRQVMPELQRLLPHKIGPHEARVRGPYVDRDYSGMEPGDWWQSDDMTGVYQFWDERPDGSLYVGQGQLLPMIDLRSTYILGFTLIPDRAYTAASIRELITNCHDVHGLPRHGFYFERGLWERSRLLKGRAADSELPIEELELGLREFGLHFEHATTAQAKIIEGMFSILQRSMQRIRGYSGRDARKDLPEHIKRQLAECKRVHPSKFFLSKTELCEQLGKLFEEYNAEQHGKRTKIIPGKSPAEVYLARRTEDVQRLSGDFRYKLASHRFPMKVGRNGILVAKSFGGGRYVSADLMLRKGERVSVWLDVGDLSRITVTDLNGERPLVVERQDPIPAMGADPAQLRGAINIQRAVVARGERVMKVLNGGAVAYRPIVADAESVRRAEEFRRKNEEHAEQKKRDAAQAREIEKLRKEQLSVDELDAMERRLIDQGLLFPRDMNRDRELRGWQLREKALAKGEGVDA